MKNNNFNIGFNKPFDTGKEINYLKEAVLKAKLSGNGIFTKKCQQFFEENIGFKKALLTTSCTDALEMSAILAQINPGDEVIMPSYTFVSTANAFILRGAKVVFVDSRKDHPGMDEDRIEEVITEKTKAIVPVHNFLWSDVDPYGGHYRRYNKKMVKRLSYKLNADLEYFSYFFSYLLPISYLLRALPYKLGKRISDKRLMDQENNQHNPKGLTKKIFDLLENLELNKIARSKVSFGASCLFILKKN